MNRVPPTFTDHFAPLAAGYDAVLSDVWGVVHNGIAPFAEACDALVRFRAGGGVVVLVTNAPRPRDVVARQLARIGVPREGYDDIVSSGDVTRAVIIERAGEAVFHIGPERDRSIFGDLGLSLAPVAEADYVVCSGLFDDTRETPDDYCDLLDELRARDLFMVCANPDLVVARGSSLVYCAGSIADRYASLGGRVLYAGKPHRPIYDEALARVAAAGKTNVQLARVLAIGDSVRTDLAGAAALGIDGLFVTGGIHAEELGTHEDPDASVLAHIFAAAGVTPKAVMRRLMW